MKRIFTAFFLLLFPAMAALALQSPSTDVYTARAIKDIVYKTVDGQELKLNLFLPEKAGEKRVGAPLLINIDAGCWYSNPDKPGNGGYWGPFGAITRGFAVASVPHRNMAEHPFPACIEDVKAAIRFLRAHAEEYGLDKNRVACMGYSSGGHVSNMMGIPSSIKTFDVGDNLDQSSQVQAVINFYGPTDLPYFFKNSHCIDCIYQVCGAKKEDGKVCRDVTPEILELAEKCSPITYVSKDSSPTLNFYGAMDRCVPISQGVRYYEALYRAGVKTQLFVSNPGVHSVPTIASNEELAKIIFDFLGWE